MEYKYFPFFIGDYLKNTMTFTQRERGAYVDLMIAYMENRGKLKDDFSVFVLTRCFTKEDQTAVEKVIQKMFKRRRGYLVSDDLDALLKKQEDVRKTKVKAGIASAKKRQEKR